MSTIASRAPDAAHKKAPADDPPTSRLDLFTIGLPRQHPAFPIPLDNHRAIPDHGINPAARRGGTVGPGSLRWCSR
ncbi:MAG: hypothetical protein ACLQIB_16720 [Isosphaeraceae bacterium]